MATYKVIQDIEAEDKLLGPLTFRQFIYGLITAVFIYFCVLGLLKHLYILLAFFLPPALFTGFFAFPWGRDQPTEIWALAKIQFLFKPHKRVWDQTGAKQLVTITVPKQIAQDLTNGLTQTEATSRLHALADTLDSRGWVTKNVNVNAFAQPSIFVEQDSDRLIDVNSLPQEVPTVDVNPSDDILDPQNNPTAQHLDAMMMESARTHHQQILNQFSSNAPASTKQQPSDYWFLNQPTAPIQLPPDESIFKQDLVLPGATDIPANEPQISRDEETAARAELKSRSRPVQSAFPHLPVINPLGTTQPVTSPKPVLNPEIQSLAGNNDLDIATIARQANHTKTDQFPDNEVTVSLH